MHTKTKTMDTTKTVRPILAKALKSIATRPNSPPPPKSLLVARGKLTNYPKLESPWQRKWLGLAITHPDIQAAAKTVETFCGGFYHGKPAERLILCGPTGNGKTSIATSIAKWATIIAIEAYTKKHWPNPPRTTLVRWQSVIDDIEERSTALALDPLLDSELLVVDDIGAETDRFKSGKPVDALTQLLSQAQGRTWLVITTNIGPDEWPTKWGDRVEDRLLRDSVVIDLSAVPSWAKL